MSSTRNLFNSPRKKAKKNDKHEKLAKQNALMKAANVHADECDDIYTLKLNDLLQKYKDWIGISKIGLFAPFLSLTSFFMHRAMSLDEEKKMTQPTTAWVEIIAYPGCKKTSIFKLYHENLLKFSPHYMRDLVQHDLRKLMHGGGTTEAWSKALCDPTDRDGNSIVLSNEFNTFLDDMDKYSSSKGDKSLLCNMFDGIGINRSTISGGEQNVDKVNVSIAGMIQPEFALPTIEAGNDSHGLYRRFFTCAPNVLFPYYDETSNMQDEVYFKPSKVWLVVVCDEVIGQSDTVYKFSNQAKDAFKDFFNKKSDECKYFSNAEKQHLIANASKSRDLVLRVAPIMQIIEMSLEFLEANPNFSFARRNEFTQPLLPAANIIKPNFVHAAIKIVEAFQKQWDLLSGENYEDDEENCLKQSVVKDVLLFKENFIKNASLLTKRNNPHTGIKHTTNEYEEVFKELSNIGLGKVKKETSGNHTEYHTFEKISYKDIIKSVETLDKWPKNVSIKDYDRLYSADEKRKENESNRGDMELSNDPTDE